MNPIGILAFLLLYTRLIVSDNKEDRIGSRTPRYTGNVICTFDFVMPSTYDVINKKQTKSARSEPHTKRTKEKLRGKVTLHVASNLLFVKATWNVKAFQFNCNLE